MRTSRGGRHVRSVAPPGALVINTRGIVRAYLSLLASVLGGRLRVPVLTDWTLSYILGACLGRGVTISGRRSWTPLRG